MKPALYLFVNKGLGMSAGKIAAQVAQATVGAWKISDKEMAKQWWEGPGHHHLTLVLEARDTKQLSHLQGYVEARGFKTYRMVDEGMTEIDPITPTVLAVEIVDKEDPHVEATFSIFQLYRDKVRVTLEIDR